MAGVAKIHDQIKSDPGDHSAQFKRNLAKLCDIAAADAIEQIKSK